MDIRRQPPKSKETKNLSGLCGIGSGLVEFDATRDAGHPGRCAYFVTKAHPGVDKNKVALVACSGDCVIVRARDLTARVYRVKAALDSFGKEVFVKDLKPSDVVKPGFGPLKDQACLVLRNNGAGAGTPVYTLDGKKMDTLDPEGRVTLVNAVIEIQN